MTENFYDLDADLGCEEKRAAAVLGCGNQGRAQALNMRDSREERVLVGNIHDKSWETAESDGFSPMPIAETVEAADICFMLVPGEVAPDVYREHGEPYLAPGKTLNFASGYNIAFGHIRPPAEVDVIMVALRMIGEALRSLLVEDRGPSASWMSTRTPPTMPGKTIWPSPRPSATPDPVLCESS